jgi:hypothetical protein
MRWNQLTSHLSIDTNQLLFKSTMTPAPVSFQESDSINGFAQMDPSKPTVYLLDIFHPDAVTHCQNLFNAILPGTPEHENWRQNAEYLLIHSSYRTAEDVSSCPKLKAVGKQGVGIDRIDSKHANLREYPFSTPQA